MNLPRLLLLLIVVFVYSAFGKHICDWDLCFLRDNGIREKYEDSSLRYKRSWPKFSLTGSNGLSSNDKISENANNLRNRQSIRSRKRRDEPNVKMATQKLLIKALESSEVGLNNHGLNLDLYPENDIIAPTISKFTTTPKFAFDSTKELSSPLVQIKSKLENEKKISEKPIPSDIPQSLQGTVIIQGHNQPTLSRVPVEFIRKTKKTPEVNKSKIVPKRFSVGLPQRISKVIIIYKIPKQHPHQSGQDKMAGMNVMPTNKHPKQKVQDRAKFYRLSSHETVIEMQPL